MGEGEGEGNPIRKNLIWKIGGDPAMAVRKDEAPQEGKKVRTEIETTIGGEHAMAEKKKENQEKEQEQNPNSLPPPPPPSLIPETTNPNRTGGIYTCPSLTATQVLRDEVSQPYQRLTWYALRKNIKGLFNQANATNIKSIVQELFADNVIRGRGLFCRSCMESQLASSGFTDVFTALVTVVNAKFPEIGKLLLVRIVLQFRRAYERNDKPQLLAGTKFMAHLVNQLVAREIIALELLSVLLENPTDDSAEVAAGFVKECGALLQDVNPQGLDGVFERFRGILHEGKIDERVRFLIEGLFAIRKDKFQGFPAIRPELDLVKQDDKITHEISLDDELDPETHLDIFKANPNFEEDEKAYETLKKSIFGEEEVERMKKLFKFRRIIYLTIDSNVKEDQKILTIKLKAGQEMDLCRMLLKCCSQESTYFRYYGLKGQRLCMMNKIHRDNFEKCFVEQYSTIHCLETHKLENVAKFFAHLLGTDALQWDVLASIRLSEEDEEEDATSSSRIFIRILLEELCIHLGMKLLYERVNKQKNTQLSSNFFTFIRLGGLSDRMEYLTQQQKPKDDSRPRQYGSRSSGWYGPRGGLSDRMEYLTQQKKPKDDSRPRQYGSGGFVMCDWEKLSRLFKEQQSDSESKNDSRSGSDGPGGPGSGGPGGPGSGGPCAPGSMVWEWNRKRERESDGESEWEWKDRRREAGRGRVKGSLREMEKAMARVEGRGTREWEEWESERMMERVEGRGRREAGIGLKRRE